MDKATDQQPSLSAEKEALPPNEVSSSSSDDDSVSDSDTDSESDSEEQQQLTSASAKQGEKEEAAEDEDDDDALWNFPPDPDHWDEWDLGEEWAEPTPYDETPGRDPETADDDPERFEEFKNKGELPPLRPYYVPYRRHYPMIPDNHPDIETPEAVVEELERMEEFLQWASYIFRGGYTYEGTVWNDFAHGKGVYTTPFEFCRYEGEWLQNMMEGHGVMEVNLPVPRYPPNSKRDKKERKKGVIYSSDFMNPEDKEWLKMDVEDALSKFPNIKRSSPPFEDDPLWLKHFGEFPEKGRHRYAGQWKHSRMHGCGIYEVNGRYIWGKFYFGSLMPEEEECTFEHSMLHASLAEVAAAKAKMFVNKPDGMVREMKGPFNDPQHPYMYEEEDLWMAPGFINGYYDVPDFWKGYVEEVDAEQQMWLNSFIKSPLRIPMPPELEYLWSNDDEFVVLRNSPSLPSADDPENVLKSKEGMEGEVLLHVPTGGIINWAKDKDGNLRLFWQPILDDGSIRPEKVVPLPLGFDKFLGDVDNSKKEIDKKKVRKEAIKKKWEDKIQQLKEKWKREDEERKRRWQEEDAERETEMKLRREEAKLMAQIEDEEFRVKIQAIEEQEERLKARSIGGTVKGKDHAEGENRSSDKKEDEGGDAEDGDEEEDDDDGNDDDRKPRSFGKVASVEEVFPIERNGDAERSERSHPFFPTTFAALSISSWFNPPPFLAKLGSLKGSMASLKPSSTLLPPAPIQLPAVATSLMPAAISSSSTNGNVKRVKLRNKNQFKALKAGMHNGGPKSILFGNLSTFPVKPLLTRRAPSLNSSKGRRANIQGINNQKKKGNASWPMADVWNNWTWLGTDILSIAIPIKR